MPEPPPQSAPRTSTLATGPSAPPESCPSSEPDEPASPCSSSESTASIALRSSFFRIDARLVHSAVTNAWVPHLKAKRLVVASERFMHNPRRRALAAHSVPEDVKLFFVREDDATTLCTLLASGESTLVVFETLGAASRAVEAGVDIRALNLGHVPAGPNRTPICPTVHLAPSDFILIDRLKARGVTIDVRALPDDGTLDLWPATPSSSIEPIERSAAVLEGDGLASSRTDEVSTDGSEPLPRSESSKRVESLVTVVNERGLHLRVAHMLAQLVSRFRSSVLLGRDGRFVNAKSLLGLTTLGAARGVELSVIAEGVDASVAIAEIERFFASDFEVST
ncbi:MAG: HPr family phosphocarrier protein [Deltaproteobacteria bacterium]|nr:HPr family phosphocarrier protein [Deltaproteobacteria bacterium]